MRSTSVIGVLDVSVMRPAVGRCRRLAAELLPESVTAGAGATKPGAHTAPPVMLPLGNEVTLSDLLCFGGDAIRGGGGNASLKGSSVLVGGLAFGIG